MSGSTLVKFVYTDTSEVAEVLLSMGDTAAAMKWADEYVASPPKPDLSPELPQEMRDLNREEYMEARQKVEQERSMHMGFHSFYLAAKRKGLPHTEVSYQDFIDHITMHEEDEPKTEVEPGESEGPSSDQ